MASAGSEVPNHSNCTEMKRGNLVLFALVYLEGCGGYLATQVHPYIAKKPYESEDFTYVIFCYYFLLFKAESSLDRKHMVSFTA